MRIAGGEGVGEMEVNKDQALLQSFALVRA